MNQALLMYWRKKAVFCLFIAVCVFQLSLANAAIYEYDELNRVISVTYSNGEKVTYNYDAAGNILSTHHNEVLWDNGAVNGGNAGDFGLITNHGVGPDGIDVQHQRSNTSWMPLTLVDDNGAPYAPYGNSLNLNSFGRWQQDTSGGLGFDLPFLVYGTGTPSPMPLWGYSGGDAYNSSAGDLWWRSLLDNSTNYSKLRTFSLGEFWNVTR